MKSICIKILRRAGFVIIAREDAIYLERTIRTIAGNAVTRGIDMRNLHKFEIADWEVKNVNF